MAMPDETQRSADQLRHEIESERGELAKAVENLRGEVSNATDLTSKLRANLPAITVGAFAVGFFLAGGISSTARFFARKSREGHERLRVGQFSIVD
jgi:hypothetical protein